jgi:hypothetical protein
MIALPSAPDDALRVVAFQLAANDDMDVCDIVEACEAAIVARGGEISVRALREVRNALYEARAKADAGKPPAAAALRSQDDPATWTATRSLADPTMWPNGQIPADIAARLRPLRRISYDMDAPIVPMRWTVKNLHVRPGIGCLFGDSGSGKTFSAIRLALCVAWGLPYSGRRVSQGGVVYVASEAGKSVRARLAAAERDLLPEISTTNLARKSQGLPRLTRAPIEVVIDAPNLSRGGTPVPLHESIAGAAEVIHAASHELTLVIIDTLHASMGGGDEQSAADAGFVIEPAKLIAETHDAHVLFVHHCGKDPEKGARGSYAFKAAWDTEIELAVDGCTGPRAPKRTDAIRRGTVLKVRDGVAGDQMTFSLKIVEIGRDEDGDALTTCVVQEIAPLGAAAPAEAGPRLSMRAREVLTLAKAQAGPDGGAILSAVREAFKRTMAGKAEGTFRNAWSTALGVLADAGVAEVIPDENRIQIIDPTHMSHAHTPLGGM